MNLTLAALAAATMLAFAGSASAELRLSTDGNGDAVYVPQYSVDNGLTSLITVGNDSDEPSVVSVLLAEALNGQSVLSFRVFLPARAVWSATIASHADGGARLTSSSDVCALPQVPAQGFELRPFDYANNFPDGGPTELQRVRNGAVEVIELGALAGSLATATTMRNCSAITAAYMVVNGSQSDRTGQILAPVGKTSANAQLVAVADGVIYRVPGSPIRGYSTRPQDPAENADIPRFSTPVLAEGATTFVTNTANGQLQFASNRGPDAISSLFMSSSLGGEYYVNPGLGATTRWVVSFPTKAAYVSNRPGSLATVGNAEAPFSTYFAANGSCDTVSTREGLLNGTPIETVAPTSIELCAQSNQLDFTDAPAASGTRLLQFVDGAERSIQAQRMDGTAVELRGLPAIGLQTSNFVNGQLQGGVLANYSISQPLRSSPAVTGQ